jgi:hypothetical protein
VVPHVLDKLHHQDLRGCLPSVVSAFGRAVLFILLSTIFYRRFLPARAKIVDKKEVKYLAAAGKSGVAGATA